MTEPTLSLAAARALHLAAQGLLQPRRRKARPDDMLAAIRQMGVLQIDTIHVVARAAAGTLAPTLTTILSPFDPVVWDRRRALELFGFDYRLECYTPAAKRKYGYFSLPILRRGALVGRIDAKAQRRSGVFELKALIIEPAARISARFTRDIAGAVQQLADWHGCPQVRIHQAMPANFGRQLQAAPDAATPEEEAA